MYFRAVGIALLGLLACGGGGGGAPAVTDAGETPDRPPADGGAGGEDARADDGGGVCAMEACGGNLLGTWQVPATCYGDGQPLDSLRCPKLSIDRRGLATTGQLTFRADFTYQMSLHTSGTLVIRYDTSCHEYTCASLEESLRGKQADDPTTVSCSEADGVCRCMVRYQDAVDQEDGSYQVSDEIATLMPSGQTAPDKHQFCVRGTSGRMSISLETSASGEPLIGGVHTLMR